MSPSDDSLFSQPSIPDVPNGVPIVLGSRFDLEIREFPKLDEMRAKLFVCQDSQWKDLGTGHVMCHDEVESFIVFRLEDRDTNYFESMIREGCAYTVQQETLICWEEFGTEVALSFRSVNGCADFYDKLHRILGKNPATGNSDSDFSSMSDSESDEMPPLEMCRLFEIEQYILDHMGSPLLRRKLAQQFNYEEFMPTLSELFHFLESIHDQVHLAKLGTIAKSLFSMSNMELFKKVLDDRYLKDLIGMFEYDVSAPKKVKHRSFVFEQSKFTEIVSIEDENCVTKIHRLYRLQYILEQCMPQPSIFDESLTETFSRYINNLRSEIFQNLLDSAFVKNLFAEIRSDATKTKRLHSLLQLFVDFVDLGIRVAGTTQGALFKGFFAHDVLSLQLPCINSRDPIVHLKSIEILDRLVTMDAPRVLSFLHRQANDSPRADAVVNKLLLLVFEDPDPELSTANLVADLMHNVLSVEPSCAPERGHFFNYFYRVSMREFVVAFVKTLQTGRLVRDDYFSANKTYCAINFINSCLQVDRARFHRLIEDFDVITTALVVLQSRHHFLALGALRLLRLAVGFRDPLFDQYIVNNDSFYPVIDCAKKNRFRENVLKSAIMDLFTFIAETRQMTLIDYAVKEYEEDLSKLMPGIYENLRSQYDNRHVPIAKRETVEKLPISKEGPEVEMKKVEENYENTDPAASSVLKPKNVEDQAKRSLPDELEDGMSKANEEMTAKKEVTQEAEAAGEKPLVDYSDSSDSDDSDDQGVEKKPAEQEEPRCVPRPSTGTPRPVKVRAAKRPSVVWDEKDKPSTTSEAKKPC